METLKEYKEEIDKIFTKHVYREFVDWRVVGSLYDELYDFLTRISDILIKEQQYRELFNIAAKAFLKWVKTDKDDSGGETMFFMESIMKIWGIIHDYDAPEISQEKMLEWFIKKLDGSVVDYMEDYIYDFMMAHFSSEKLLQLKLIFMQQRIADRTGIEKECYYNDFEIKRWKEYVLQIMGELKYAIEEIREHAAELKGDSSRCKLAEIELLYGNNKEAIAIYQELADKEEPNIFRKNEYRIILKDVYKSMGDDTRYKAELKKIVYREIGNTELFLEYKTLFSEENWIGERDNIFQKIKSGDCRANTWYKLEGQYVLLMENVEVGGEFYLKEYEAELKTLFPDRCLNILINSANAQAQNSSKRSHYHSLAKTLKWMKRYPEGKEKAAWLAQQYRSQYSRRPAMLDELRKI
jgi:hypothetical protein